MTGPNQDRISLLPDCLLEDILVRLPLPEVVRTSVLSKRWISLWTQLSKLVFDKSFCTESVRNDENRLMLIISNFLFRSRKPILDFTLSLKGLSNLEIDQLMDYVCNNGVEYFNLKIRNPKLYELCSLDQLRSVKHLSLKSCFFSVPSGFKGLTMLTYLNFYNVTIDGEELSMLVKSCPLLEVLVLKNLFCFYLNLAAPNLRVIRCEGFYFTFCLEFAPRLEEMSVSVYDTAYDVERDADEDNGPEDLLVPFELIPAIKYMALDGTFLMYMNAGIEAKISRCRNALNHLKTIELTDVSFEFIEVSQNVLSLIRRSPNLETIVVTISTEQQNDQASGVWQTKDLSDVSLNGLRQACVLNITAKQSELLFIETILAKSPMLEVMVFRLNSGLNEENGLRIGEEIRRLRRASPQVKMINMDPKTKLSYKGYLL